MIYDLLKRIFLLKKYYELKSFSAVQSAFRVKFKVKVAPAHQIIKNIFQAFEKTGSVVPGRTKRQIPTQKRQETKKTAWNHDKGISQFVNPQSSLGSQRFYNIRVLYPAWRFAP